MIFVRTFFFPQMNIKCSVQTKHVSSPNGKYYFDAYRTNHETVSDFCWDKIGALGAIFIASESCSCSWNTAKQKGIISPHKGFYARYTHSVCVCFRFRNGIKASMRSLSNRLYFKRIEMAFDSHRLNNPGDGIFMLISQMFVLSFSIATNC